MPDEDTIQALLAALEFRSVSEVFATSGDSGAATWRVRHAGGTVAVRVFPPGHAAAVERERRCMATARAAGLPVPAIERITAWQGRPVMVLEWLAGRTVADELATHPWRAWHQGVLFGRMQAAIHQIMAPPDTPSWLDWLEDADQSLRLRLAAGSQKENHRLLHCDYHPLNVLTDGNRITGVLDWTNALAGDPRADVARTVTILRLDSGPPSFAKSLLLWLFEGGWRRGYIQAGGTLPDMARFNLWAGMVMAEDLAAKRSPAHLARIHRWVARWRARLGWDA